MLATYEALCDTTGNARLKKMTQQSAVTKTPVPVLLEGRMVWDTVGQIKTTEPAVCQIQMDLFTEPRLGSDTEAIAHQKHADQQLWIDGRPVWL